MENTSQSQLEWFRWWLGQEEVKKGLGQEEVKKGLGLIIMFSVLALIVTIAIVIVYLSIIKGEITPSGVSGLTIMVGFLVLIMLLPSLRKFKVAEIELEIIEITSVKPENDLEPTLSPKLVYKSVSV
jgi:multisubunit Na+/H+ antiporter MnhF subunit